MRDVLLFIWLFLVVAFAFLTIGMKIANDAIYGSYCETNKLWRFVSWEKICIRNYNYTDIDGNTTVKSSYEEIPF